MKSKKIRSLFCAAALTLSLAACGSKTSDCSGQTITGEITDIDGTAVTMQLGELSAGGMPSHDVSDSSDSGQTPLPVDFHNSIERSWFSSIRERANPRLLHTLQSIRYVFPFRAAITSAGCPLAFCAKLCVQNPFSNRISQNSASKLLPSLLLLLIFLVPLSVSLKLLHETPEVFSRFVTHVLLNEIGEVSLVK